MGPDQNRRATPPPLPRRSAPPPVPSRVVPPPRPPQQLSYAATHVPLARPPINLRGIGAASLVLGLLGSLVNLLVVIAHLHLFFSTVSPSEPGFVPLEPPTPRVAFDGDWIGERGLKREIRRSVIAAVERHQSLGLDEQEMLDRLLADVGAEIFSPFDDPGPAIEEVKRQPEGEVTFRAGERLVRVGQQIASVRLPDGSHWRVNQRILVAPNTELHWSATEINDYLYAGQVLHSGMNALQAAAAGEALSALRPSPGASPSTPMPASWDPKAIVLVMPDGPIYFLPDGRAATEPQVRHARISAPGFPTVDPSSEFGRIRGSRLATAIGAFISIGYLALSLHLVVIGVSAIRRRVSAVREHIGFAVTKIVLVGLDIVVAIWFFQTLDEGLSKFYSDLFGTKITMSTGEILFSGIVEYGIRLYYPVLLLIGLHTRSVQRFVLGAGERGTPLAYETRARLHRWFCRQIAVPMSRTVLACVALLCLGVFTVHLFFSIRYRLPDQNGIATYAVDLACMVVTILGAATAVWILVRERAKVQLPKPATTAVCGLVAITLLSSASTAAPRRIQQTGSSSVSLLVKMARSATDVQVRSDALRALAEKDVPGAIGLLQLINRSDRKLSREAAKKFPSQWFDEPRVAELEAPMQTAVQEILYMLQQKMAPPPGWDDDASLLRFLARARIDQADLHIVEQWVSSSNVEVRVWARRIILNARGDEQAILERGVRMLQTHNPEEANAIVEQILSRVGAGYRLLANKLPTLDPAVQKRVYGHLVSKISENLNQPGARLSPEDETILLQSLEAPIAAHHQRAMQVLLRAGSDPQRYFEYFVPLLKANDGMLRNDVKQHLRILQSPRTLARSIEMLSSTDHRKRLAGLWGIEFQMTPKERGPLVIPRLEDDHPEVRRVATEILDDPQILPTLGLGVGRRIEEIRLNRFILGVAQQAPQAAEPRWMIPQQYLKLPSRTMHSVRHWSLRLSAGIAACVVIGLGVFGIVHGLTNAASAATDTVLADHSVSR